MLKSKIDYYLYKSVSENNILPITSRCNLNCIFCSHKQNPKDFEIINLGSLDYQKVIKLADYLNSNRPIIIGESATKIIEGEPLTHPEFLKIIKYLKRRYKSTEIRITSNSTYLDDRLINELDDLNNIVLNISINSMNHRYRKEIMGKSNLLKIDKKLRTLKNSEIKFSFSMVGLPHIYGYKYIKEDILKMFDYNPSTIRLFMPGFTKFSSKTMNFDFKKVYNELSSLVQNINKLNKIPIILEPPFLKDLSVNVIGVLNDSPAAEAGINYLDQILEVDKIRLKSNVDAFNTLKDSKDPKLLIKRGQDIFQKVVKKNKKERSGIILNYDITVKKIDQIKRFLIKNINKKILLLTSYLGYELINSVIKNELSVTKLQNIKIDKVKNQYLKGSIMSAGLLTNYDIKNYLNSNHNKYDLLVLPEIMY
ncbi:MAG: DUF512 domain-containing protein, partial [Halanaerobiales bacterium]|nr:DUF512 domain-containing protein [Halanaerobiales bacterium]